MKCHWQQWWLCPVIAGTSWCNGPPSPGWPICGESVMGAEGLVNKLIPGDPDGVLSLSQWLSKHMTVVADTLTTPWKSSHCVLQQ